mgnify:CR=1 FL=1
MSFEELGETVRTANADNSTEAEQRQAAVTLARIEGTNLYDAVVENINGGLARWRNCWDATKRNWLRLPSLPKLAVQARNTKRST